MRRAATSRAAGSRRASRSARCVASPTRATQPSSTPAHRPGSATSTNAHTEQGAARGPGARAQPSRVRSRPPLTCRAGRHAQEHQHPAVDAHGGAGREPRDRLPGDGPADARGHAARAPVALRGRTPAPNRDEPTRRARLGHGAVHRAGARSRLGHGAAQSWATVTAGA
eukprot:2626239-Prymnesium_polylepis.1